MLYSHKTKDTHNSLKSTITINIGDEPLSSVSEYKYFGIYIDKFLNFHKHIVNLRGTINARIYSLSKGKYLMNTKTALLLFKTMILSYYDIGDLFYNSCTKLEIKKLQSLQNKALRIIYLDHSNYDTATLHQKAGLSTLQARRNLNLIRLVHSRKIPALCSPKVSQRHTRSSSSTLFSVPFSNNCKFRNSFVLKSIQQ